ncbi:glutamine amidotransferase-related protein, partial [Borreliella garinii]
MNVRAILILDFGSQYSQLIARRIREIGVYTIVMPYCTPLKEIENMNIAGIILSGGPDSVYLKEAPTLNME